MATRTSKPASTNTTNAWESSRLATSQGWIVDDQNRVVILHGINLSGGAKMPFYRPEASLSSTAPTSWTSSLVSHLPTSILSQPTLTHAHSATRTEDRTDTTSQDDIGTTRADGVPGVVYSYEEENFFHHRHVSFVNRPFPLQEADLHFQRLARWGCQCLRVLVPWEALEHAGP